MTTHTPSVLPRSKRTLTLIATCLAVLILPASLTGTSVATPQINAELTPGLVELQWVVNAYNLTFACFMLIAGSLSDIVGRKRIFTIGTALFAACSLASAVTSSILVLDVARGLSGVGAAAMMTAGSALLANAFTGKHLATVFAVFGSAAGAGLAIGPSVSGLLVGAFGWRSVFAFHLIVAVVVLLLAIGVPAGPKAPTGTRIDWGGALTFAPALFAFVLAITEGPQLGWAHPLVLGLLAATVLLGIVFAVIELRSAQPMFDFALFRNPRFFIVCVIPVALAFSFVSLLIYLPIYFTAAAQLTSGAAGGVIAIMTVPVVIAPLIVGRLLAKGASSRWLLTVAMLLIAAGTALLTVINPATSIPVLIAPLVLIGAGMGMTAGILDGAAVSSVPPARAGIAAGMFNTARLGGEAVGIAVVGTVLVALVQSMLRTRLPAGLDAAATANQVLAGNTPNLTDGNAALSDLLAGTFTDALHIVLWGMTILALATAALTAAILRDPKVLPADNTGEELQANLESSSV